MKTTIFVLCLIWACVFAVESEQSIVLHPSAYYLAKMDTSLDNSPKCMTCRHIITALRNHFSTMTPQSQDSVIYEADPCSLAPQTLQRWCGDVYKKMLQCNAFLSNIWDRSQSAVKICEECTYDQFPLPAVRYCDNQLYQPIHDDLNDRCNQCVDMVRSIAGGNDPCGSLTEQACKIQQDDLSTCTSFNKFIHQPFVFARRICEECAQPLDDLTRPPGFTRPMYCQRPIPSPMLDNSMCSVCVNLVHNGRTFPTESPCRDMPDATCSYVQDRLEQCVAFQRMKDQLFYSALSICEECTDNKNPTGPTRFCAGQLRVGSSHLVFSPEKPEQQSSNNPGTFDKQTSPFLKPEPPAPFATPIWQKFNQPCKDCKPDAAEKK